MKYKYLFIFIILLVCLIVYPIFSPIIEDFQPNTNNNVKWSIDLIKRFNKYQYTVNENNYEYNLDELQKQVSPEDVEYLLKTGKWYWSDDLKKQYIEEVWSNPMIKTDPNISLEQSMKIYNQRAMTEILAWNSKEGELLLYGITTKEHKNINGTNKDSIKCSPKSGVMEKTLFKGMNLWNGYTNTKTISLKPEELTNEIPGFSFVSNPCNPCSAIDGNFNCPFILNVDNNANISDPWKVLWGLIPQ
jgi:hypothetical protein